MAIGELQWSPTKPAGTDLPHDIDGHLKDNNKALQRLLQNYIRGCNLVYNDDDTVTISVGEIALPFGDNLRMRTNTSTITADVSSADADSIYKVFAVADSATVGTFTGEIVKQGSDPSGSYVRYLGSVATDSSGDIYPFYQMYTTNLRKHYFKAGVISALTVVDVNPGTINEYVDVDLSQFMPNTSTLAIMVSRRSGISGSGTFTVDFRAKGQSNFFRQWGVQQFTVQSSPQAVWNQPLDASQVWQYLLGTAGTEPDLGQLKIDLAGWWEEV